MDRGLSFLFREIDIDGVSELILVTFESVVEFELTVEIIVVDSASEGWKFWMVGEDLESDAGVVLIVEGETFISDGMFVCVWGGE